MSKSLLVGITAAAVLALAPAAHAAVTIGPASQSVAEAAGKVDVRLSRSAVPLLGSTAAVPVTVALGRPGDTAECPADLSPCSVTVMLAGNMFAATAGVASFTLVSDTAFEGNETISARITAAPGETFDANTSAAATITDDDPQPAVSIGGLTAPEGTAAGGTTTFALPIALSAASGRPVGVGFDVIAGSADGNDVSLLSGTVSIAAGQTTATAPVLVVADGVDEDDEGFTVRLEDPVGASLGAVTTGAGTIADDDTAVLSVANAFGAEGSGSSSLAFPVTLSTPSAKTVTARFATADRSATAPADYAATAGTLTFAPGETAKEVRVGVVGDGAAEPDEAFALELSAPVGAGLGAAAALGGILNDDFGAAPGASGPGAGADVRAPKGKLAKVTLKKPGTLRSSYGCPAAEKSCRVQLTVFTVAKPRGKVKRLRRELKLAATTVTIAGGKTGALSAKIPASALKLLRQAKVTKVRAYAVVRDASGNVGTSQSSGTLRP